MFESLMNRRYCGSILDVESHQAFRRVCLDNLCRSRYINEETQRRKIAEEDRYKERREITTNYVLGNLASGQHVENKFQDDLKEKERESYTSMSLPVFPVPALQRELTALPAGRRIAFLAHLRGCVDESFDENIEDATQSLADDCDGSNIVAPLPILRFACGTCRGDCCRNGGTHAFLSKDLVHRVRRNDPTATKEEIFEMYESRLIENTYDGSCVFQQEFGCGLPRELRANLCNTFECEDLVYLQREPNSQVAVLVAMEGATMVRSQEFVTPEVDVLEGEL